MTIYQALKLFLTDADIVGNRIYPLKPPKKSGITFPVLVVRRSGREQVEGRASIVRSIDIDILSEDLDEMLTTARSVQSSLDNLKTTTIGGEGGVYIHTCHLLDEEDNFHQLEGTPDGVYVCTQTYGIKMSGAS